MKRFLAAYGATFLTFIAMDVVWLTNTLPRLYKPEIGPLLLDQPKLAPGALFYLLYIAGLVILAVLPGVERGSWARASLNGALFGFIAYATYDLTNLATLKGFSVKVTVADMIWGAVVSGVAASVGYAAARWVKAA
jgi:uncharacterized membrane protein